MAENEQEPAVIMSVTVSKLADGSTRIDSYQCDLMDMVGMAEYLRISARCQMIASLETDLSARRPSKREKK